MFGRGDVALDGEADRVVDVGGAFRVDGGGEAGEGGGVAAGHEGVVGVVVFEMPDRGDSEGN